MKWALGLGRFLARRISPQELVDLAGDVWPDVCKQIPPDQRVGFLKNAAEKHLGILLAGLSRKERAALMNDILPLAAREFPISELDFLTAFSSPGDRYHPEDTNQ